MKMYRSKSFEAFRFRIDPIPDWFMDAVSKNTVITNKTSAFIVNTEKAIYYGNYVFRGLNGRILCLNEYDFEFLHEEVKSGDTN